MNKSYSNVHFHNIADQIVSTSGGAIDGALLIGHGGEVWAATNQGTFDANVSATIARGMGNKGDLQANGLIIAGKKFKYLKDVDEFNTAFLGEAGGLLIYKTNKAYVLAYFQKKDGNDGRKIESMIASVSRIGDYLIQSGY